MADPLSILAAAASLADIAVRVSKQIYSFSSAIRGASAEMGRLHKNVLEVRQRLSLTQELSHLYCNSTPEPVILESLKQLHTTILACTDDLSALETLLGGKNGVPSTSLNRFGKRVKSVFNERSIERLSLQVETHKLSIIAILTVMGRSHDLKTIAGLSSIKDELQNQKEVLGSHLNSLKINLSFHATKTQQSQAETRNGLARYHTVMQTRNREIKSLLEYNLAQAATQHEVVLNKMAQNQMALSKSFQSHAALSENRLKAIRSSHSVLQSQLDSLRCRIDCLQVNVLSQGSSATAVFNGLASDAIISLSQVYPHLHELLSLTPIEGTSELGSNHSDWVMFEFQSLLDDAVAARSQELQLSTPKRSRKDSALDPTQPPSVQESGRLIRKRIPALDPQFTPVITHTDQHSTEIELSTGRLVLVTTRDYNSRKVLVTTARIVFIPPARYNIKGVTATFMKMFGRSQKLPPYVSIFGIHPNSHRVFDHIKTGNIKEIRKLFVDGVALPSDRDEMGNSLLAYAVESLNIETCRFLLENGANPHDCTRVGDGALVHFITRTSKAPKENPHPKDCIIEFLRLFLKYCGTDVVKVLPYTGWAGGNKNAVASLAHTALEEFLMGSIGVLDAMQLLGQYECDLEERNFHGNTVLLASVSLVSFKELVPVATVLLDFGANPLAVSPRGWGVLHGLLWRLSACNHFDMDDREAASLVKLIKLLLKHGCNPLQFDCDGCSPSDLALSPTCWVLWCRALEESGFSVANIIREDSLARCGTHVEVDVQGRFVRAKMDGQKAVTTTYAHPQTGNELESDVVEKCYRCHRTNDWKCRSPPFDCFGSYLMRLPNRPPIHRFSPDHPNGKACLDHFGIVTCDDIQHDDGPMREHSLGLSWRKQLAYQLWREGHLVTPLQAYRWAKDCLWEVNHDAKFPLVKGPTNLEVRKAACPMLQR